MALDAIERRSGAGIFLGGQRDRLIHPTLVMLAPMLRAAVPVRDVWRSEFTPARLVLTVVSVLATVAGSRGEIHPYCLERQTIQAQVFLLDAEKDVERGVWPLRARSGSALQHQRLTFASVCRQRIEGPPRTRSAHRTEKNRRLTIRWSRVTLPPLRSRVTDNRLITDSSAVISLDQRPPPRIEPRLTPSEAGFAGVDAAPADPFAPTAEAPFAFCCWAMESWPL